MKIFKRILIILLILILVSVAVFAGMWVYFASKLDVSKITDVSQTIEIFDTDDTYVTGVYAEQNRSKINIKDLPDHVKKAFISIEDERFYKHIGIDVKRIFGAALTNIKSGGKEEGASTITQQLIKLSHLSSEKTFTRKIKEAFLSLELERRYSKDEILEMYLNYCYFGNGAYGIETAAQKYFGISAKDLSISQSAMLAGILKSPSKYAPHLKYENSVKRRDLVLKQMEHTKNITQAEYQAALKETIVISKSAEETYPYGYYIDTVLYEAEKALNMDSEEMMKEGYKIYTYMDTSVQNSIEKAVKTELPENSDGKQPEAAMVVLDKDGGIVGIMGGREHTNRRGFNRALDSRRSPGSAIKPVLVYAPAYEQKAYTNATFLLDQKKAFGSYSPSNVSNKYYGWVTAKQALSLSLNIPAVETLNQVGIEKAKDYGKSVGLTFDSTDNHLALALGGFSTGVSPTQLSGSYLPFMNGGFYSEPTAIRKIVDKNGKTVFSDLKASTKVLSEETAFLLTDVMKEVIKSGTGKRLQSLNMNIAAKTGTSNIQGTSDNRDAWIVSYSTDYICTAWIGYDDGSALSSRISGGSYPASLVEQFYLDIYKGNKPADFVKPSNVVQVRLDKTMLANHKLALASEYAPDSQVQLEYFAVGTAPTEYSQYHQQAPEIQGFNVSLGKEGYPVITFKSESNNISYTVYRIDSDNETPIYETQGQDKILSFVDRNVEENTKYEYYVMAKVGENQMLTNKASIKTGKFGENENTRDTTESSSKSTQSSSGTTEKTTATTTTADERRSVGTRQRH